jgi:ABC-type proline/glycine betaine transport system permease subunit
MGLLILSMYFVSALVGMAGIGNLVLRDAARR